MDGSALERAAAAARSSAVCALDGLSLLRLDVLGLVALAVALAIVGTACCCCLLCCNGFGRRRWWQQLGRMVSRAEPFIDLAGERVGSRSLTSLGFVFGFALASGAVVSRSILLTHVGLFPPREGEAVGALRPLCAEPLWDALLRLAPGGYGGAAPSPGAAWAALALDALWEGTFASLRADCAAWPIPLLEAQAAVQPGAAVTALALPAIAVAVESATGRALGERALALRLDKDRPPRWAQRACAPPGAEPPEFAMAEQLAASDAAGVATFAPAALGMSRGAGFDPADVSGCAVEVHLRVSAAAPRRPGAAARGSNATTAAARAAAAGAASGDGEPPAELRLRIWLTLAPPPAPPPPPTPPTAPARNASDRNATDLEATYGAWLLTQLMEALGAGSALAPLGAGRGQGAWLPHRVQFECGDALEDGCGMPPAALRAGEAANLTVSVRALGSGLTLAGVPVLAYLLEEEPVAALGAALSRAAGQSSALIGGRAAGGGYALPAGIFASLRAAASSWLSPGEPAAHGPVGPPTRLRLSAASRFAVSDARGVASFEALTVESAPEGGARARLFVASAPMLADAFGAVRSTLQARLWAAAARALGRLADEARGAVTDLAGLLAGAQEGVTAELAAAARGWAAGEAAAVAQLAAACAQEAAQGVGQGAEASGYGRRLASQAGEMAQPQPHLPSDAASAAYGLSAALLAAGGDVAAALSLAGALSGGGGDAPPSAAEWLERLGITDPFSARTACARRVDQNIADASSRLAERLTENGMRLGGALALAAAALLRQRGEAALDGLEALLGGALDSLASTSGLAAAISPAAAAAVDVSQRAASVGWAAEAVAARFGREAAPSVARGEEGEAADEGAPDGARGNVLLDEVATASGAAGVDAGWRRERVGLSAAPAVVYQPWPFAAINVLFDRSRAGCDVPSWTEEAKRRIAAPEQPGPNETLRATAQETSEGADGEADEAGGQPTVLATGAQFAQSPEVWVRGPGGEPLVGVPVQLRLERAQGAELAARLAPREPALRWAADDARGPDGAERPRACAPAVRGGACALTGDDGVARFPRLRLADGGGSGAHALHASAFGVRAPAPVRPLRLVSSQAPDPSVGLMLLFVESRSFLLLSLAAIPLLAANRPWAMKRSAPHAAARGRGAASAAAAAHAGRRALVWRMPICAGAVATLAAWAGWTVAIMSRPDPWLARGASQPVGFSPEDVTAARPGGEPAAELVSGALLLLWAVVATDLLLVAARPLVRARVAARAARAAAVGAALSSASGRPREASAARRWSRARWAAACDLGWTLADRLTETHAELRLRAAREHAHALWHLRGGERAPTAAQVAADAASHAARSLARAAVACAALCAAGARAGGAAGHAVRRALELRARLCRRRSRGEVLVTAQSAGKLSVAATGARGRARGARADAWTDDEDEGVGVDGSLARVEEGLTPALCTPAGSAGKRSAPASGLLYTLRVGRARRTRGGAYRQTALLEPTTGAARRLALAAARAAHALVARASEALRARAAPSAHGLAASGEAAPKAGGSCTAAQRRAWADARARVLLPQRLLMAMALSGWVVCLLTLALLTAASWVDAAVGEAVDEAQALGGQLGVRATNWALSLAPAWRAPSLVLGQLLLLLPAATRELLRGYLLAAIRAAACALALASTCAWWLSVRNYRATMRALRRGAPPFARAGFSIAAVGRYVGFQVVHSVVGWLALAATLLVLALPACVVALASPGVGVLDARIYAAVVVGGRALGVRLGLTCVLPLAFQSAMDRFIFVRGGWFQHRLLHSLYDYNFIFCNAVIGLFVVGTRLLFVFATNLLSLSRLDVPLLPPSLVAYDPGYRAFVALALTDHQYTNPHLVLATDHLIGLAEADAHVRTRAIVRRLRQLELHSRRTRARANERRKWAAGRRGVAAVSAALAGAAAVLAPIAETAARASARCGHRRAASEPLLQQKAAAAGAAGAAAAERHAVAAPAADAALGGGPGEGAAHALAAPAGEGWSPLPPQLQAGPRMRHGRSRTGCDLGARHASALKASVAAATHRLHDDAALGAGMLPSVDSAAAACPRRAGTAGEQGACGGIELSHVQVCHARLRSDGRGLGHTPARLRQSPAAAAQHAAGSDLARELGALQRRYTGWAKAWRLYLAQRARLLAEAGMPLSVAEGGLTLGQALVERRRALATARRVRNRLWLWLLLWRTPALRAHRRP